ncbi:unnamed protein product [Absidia cylindrospora]
MHLSKSSTAYFLVNHLIKILLKNQSEKKLSDYANRPGFSRSFRANLRHCGSFLGRDYKNLMQIMPMLLSMLFPINNNTDTNMLDNNNTDITMIGNDTDTTTTDQTTSELMLHQTWYPVVIGFYQGSNGEHRKELTDALFIFDRKFPANHTPFSCMPKVHLLHHLPQNIARFGPPLHYETEKGEQFNKFIRERIINTNRHSVSRDIAKMFARHSRIRHMVEGGRWQDLKKDDDDDEKQQQQQQQQQQQGDNDVDEYDDTIHKCGNEALDFISEEAGLFFPSFFGDDREYQDNNDTHLRMVDGQGGVFCMKPYHESGPSDDVYIIGKAKKSGNNYSINKYVCVGKDTDGNLLVKASDLWFPLQRMTLKGVLDMETKTAQGYNVINQYKFGSYWLLHNRFG